MTSGIDQLPPWRARRGDGAARPPRPLDGFARHRCRAQSPLGAAAPAGSSVAQPPTQKAPAGSATHRTHAPTPTAAQRGSAPPGSSAADPQSARRVGQASPSRSARQRPQGRPRTDPDQKAHDKPECGRACGPPLSAAAPAGSAKRRPAALAKAAAACPRQTIAENQKFNPECLRVAWVAQARPDPGRGCRRLPLRAGCFSPFASGWLGAGGFGGLSPLSRSALCGPNAGRGARVTPCRCALARAAGTGARGRQDNVDNKNNNEPARARESLHWESHTRTRPTTTLKVCNYNNLYSPSQPHRVDQASSAHTVKASASGFPYRLRWGGSVLQS